MGETATAPEARPGIRVVGGTGDIDRTCPACGTNDASPRHIIVGVRVEEQLATLPDGKKLPVQVPIDEAYHHHCHADLGCDHCADLLAHNEVEKFTEEHNAETINVPDHLVSLIPGEFTVDERGAHRRVMSKEDAETMLAREHQNEGFEYVPHAQADQLHAAHAASMKAGG